MKKIGYLSVMGFIMLTPYLFTGNAEHPLSDAPIRKDDKMFLGLRTVIYHVDDLERAKDWYAKAFGVMPYFDEPFYVGFNIGGFELGLDPDMEGIRKGKNEVVYWGVQDIDTVYQHLLDMGVKENEAVRDVGGDVKVATVMDPFGNVVGIIENPHFRME